MVKQLGLPTFFMTVSCADLRRNELILIIPTLRGETFTDNDINKMDFFDRCSFLNLSPVLLARHFHYRVEVFFQDIVLNGPLGKIKNHATPVEFQVHGSPQIHSFLWILNHTVLSKDNINEYIFIVDNIVSTSLADTDNEL